MKLLPFIFPLITTLAHALVYDYVIVGGGTSGLLLATTLTQNPKTTVAVLEAGSSGLDDVDIQAPSKEGAIEATQHDWNFTTVAQENLYQKTTVPAHRGKVLGGSSAMNYMIWHRMSSKEADAYESVLGNAGWNWDSLFQAYKASEHFFNPPSNTPKDLSYNDEFHGMTGAIHGSMSKQFYSFYSDYLLPALRNIGVAKRRDFDGGITAGAGAVPLAVDQSTYTRSYSGSAYAAVKGRSNLNVLTNAQASRIMWDSSTTSNTAVSKGVEYLNVTNNNAKTQIEGKNVILSAGAIQSPQLLELSGVGDPSILNSVGITTVVNLPAVGTGFADHLTHAGSFTTNNSGTYTGSDQPQTFLHLAPASEFLSASDLKIFKRMLGPATAPESIDQANWNMLKYLLKSDQPLIEFGWYDTFVNTYLYHPLSSGTVHVDDSNPFKPPLIDPAFNSAEVNGKSIDLWLLSKALVYLSTNVTASSPLASIAARYSIKKSLPFDQFEAKVFQKLSGGDHQIGGARMLPKAKGGVVDENLLVYGTSNVRVVDCSIVPTPPGQHAMGLAYAIAMRAAGLLTS